VLPSDWLVTEVASCGLPAPVAPVAFHFRVPEVPGVTRVPFGMIARQSVLAFE
jgi:hypothetical protein